MTRDWTVAARAPKFHKGVNTSDINKIARRAAKAHREIIGKNPFRKIPEGYNDCLGDGSLGIAVYHYSGNGLFVLDNEIKEYIKENKEALDSQIESVQVESKIKYLLNTDKGSKKIDKAKLDKIIALSTIDSGDIEDNDLGNLEDLQKSVIEHYSDIENQDFIPF